MAKTHGKVATYSSGCRCDPCTWAWASYARGERPAVPVPTWFDNWVRSGGSI